MNLVNRFRLRRRARRDEQLVLDAVAQARADVALGLRESEAVTAVALREGGE